MIVREYSTVNTKYKQRYGTRNASICIVTSKFHEFIAGNWLDWTDSDCIWIKDAECKW